MNQKLKVTAIIGLAAMVLGGATMAIGYFGNHGKLDSIILNQGFKIQKIEKKTRNITAFKDLKISSNDVDLQVVQGSHFKLTTSLDQTDTFKVTQKDGQLQIDSTNSVTGHGLSFSNSQRKIIVTVPHDAKLENIKLKTFDGTISLKSITATKRVEINQTDGGVILKNVNLSDLNVVNKDSGTRVEGGQISNATFKNIDGDFLAIGTTFTGTNKVTLDDGEVHLNELKQNLEISADVNDGSIVHNGKAVGNDNQDSDSSHGIIGASQDNKLAVQVTDGSISISDTKKDEDY